MPAGLSGDGPPFDTAGSGAWSAHEAGLLRYIDESSWAHPTEDAAWSALALSSFRLQARAIPAYGAFARYLGRDPDALHDWRDIPAVPASAFKSHDLAAARSGGRIFETSGTTISRPGRVRLASTRLYERSLLRNAARHLLPEGARLQAVVLGPTESASPRSSLWFMVDRIVGGLCEGGVWAIDEPDAPPRWEAIDAALDSAERARRPVMLLGTTLLFAAYFEWCGSSGIRFQLPPGSRAMDTGGAKGLRAEFDRREIEEGFARVLGIPADHLVNEYGMAETGTQYYEDSLLAAHEGRPARPGRSIPPWARVRVLDPESLRETEEGAPGVLVFYDLANLETPLAIQTEDLGTRSGERVHLAGRLPQAERRGCSLPFERFLERAGPP